MREQRKAAQAGRAIGDALRHCRRAVKLNLRDGPTAAVAESVKQARDALDGAALLCKRVRGQS